MELLGHEPGRVHGTLHFVAASGRHASSGGQFVLPTGTFATDFHVFRLDWEGTAIRWFVDDHLYHTTTNWQSGRNPFPAPFDQRFHLLLNLAVGGDWPGKPDSTTVFPQQMVVDYVRIYRRK
jgi:beta-glucanase (GH16 family)